MPHYVPAYRYGGPLQVAHELGKAMVRAGHLVVVCTTNQADEHSDLEVPIDKPVDTDGVRVYYEPVIGWRYWGLSFGLWHRAKKEIAIADFVIVHYHYQFANWAGAILARHYNKPYVLFAHGSLRKSGIENKHHWQKLVYLQVMEKRNLQDAMFIAYNAAEEMDNSLFRDQGKIIPSGIDPHEFRETSSRGSFRNQSIKFTDKVLFLFLGRLNVEQKGLDLLLPAFANVYKNNPTAHLVLVGPDESRGEEKVRSLIDQLGIEQGVTLTGLLVGDKKHAVLEDADVFILPSRSEGMSIALLEAIYFGLPLITTNRVGLSKTITDLECGLVVEPDIEALTDAFEAMLDSRVRKSMQGRGKSFIEEHYNWDKVATNLVEQMISESCVAC